MDPQTASDTVSKKEKISGCICRHRYQFVYTYGVWKNLITSFYLSPLDELELVGMLQHQALPICPVSLHLISVF